MRFIRLQGILFLKQISVYFVLREMKQMWLCCQFFRTDRTAIFHISIHIMKANFFIKFMCMFRRLQIDFADTTLICLLHQLCHNGFPYAAFPVLGHGIDVKRRRNSVHSTKKLTIEKNME